MVIKIKLYKIKKKKKTVSIRHYAWYFGMTVKFVQTKVEYSRLICLAILIKDDAPHRTSLHFCRR